MSYDLSPPRNVLNASFTASDTYELIGLKMSLVLHSLF